MTHNNEETICTFYKSGKSTAELATLYQVTKTTIINVLKRYSIERRHNTSGPKKKLRPVGPVKEKACIECGDIKPNDKFYKASQSVDGIGSYCKDCDGKLRKQRCDKPRMSLPNDYQQQCQTCQHILSAEAFYKDKHTAIGLSTSCKECARGAARKRSAGHRQQHPYDNMRWHYRVKYNLEIEQVIEMLVAQGNHCMICKSDLFYGDKKKRPVIDHDHKTNIIRAILCVKCNTGLGSFKDDISLLKSAISYLEFYSSMGVSCKS